MIYLDGIARIVDSFTSTIVDQPILPLYTLPFVDSDYIVVTHNLGHYPAVGIFGRINGRYGRDGFGSNGFGMTIRYYPLLLARYTVVHTDVYEFVVDFVDHYTGKIVYS